MGGHICDARSHPVFLCQTKSADLPRGSTTRAPASAQNSGPAGDSKLGSRCCGRPSLVSRARRLPSRGTRLLRRSGCGSRSRHRWHCGGPGSNRSATARPCRRANPVTTFWLGPARVCQSGDEMRAAAGGVSLVVATDREFAILANQRADVRRDRTPRAPETTIHSRAAPRTVSRNQQI
jgi:hypothetical protein